MNIAEYLDRVKPLLVVLNIQYVYVIEEISARMITSKLEQDSHFNVTKWNSKEM